MNSSNSFNICPRCGNSNALNAKYCSRCGGQLKVPEEPVVCHKCHTRNTPMANFCRNCGTALKVGSETKICPRCGKEVSGDKAICECGYSFITFQQTVPNVDKAVDVSALREDKTAEAVKKEKTKEKMVSQSSSAGRAWAIVALVLLLVFAYFTIAPYQIINGETGEVSVTLRPEFLAKFDKGFVNNEEFTRPQYGYDLVSSLINLIKAVSGEATFGEVVSAVGFGTVMLLVLTVVFILTAFAHLIVCIIRCITSKRSKVSNLYFLIVAIVSTLLVGLITLFNMVQMPEGIMQSIAAWFALSTGAVIGYAVWAIPLYFWLFYLISLGAKEPQPKAQV